MTAFTASYVKTGVIMIMLKKNLAVHSNVENASLKGCRLNSLHHRANQSTDTPNAGCQPLR